MWILPKPFWSFSLMFVIIVNKLIIFRLWTWKQFQMPEQWKSPLAPSQAGELTCICYWIVKRVFSTIPISYFLQEKGKRPAWVRFKSSQVSHEEVEGSWSKWGPGSCCGFVSDARRVERCCWEHGTVRQHLFYQQLCLHSPKPSSLVGCDDNCNGWYSYFSSNAC